MSKNGNNHSRSDEIITLLYEVSQRLRKNENERVSFRETLEDLENKADQMEKAYLSAHDRISKTESALENRQTALEKAQQEQAVRIEKAAQMADRIEEAMAQHTQISRRIDEVMKDKAKMIRQLETIEETVIETQEAVRSQALVLADRPGAPAGFRPQKTFSLMRGGALAALVVLGVAGGWSLGQWQMNETISTRLAALDGTDPARFAAREQDDAAALTAALAESLNNIETAAGAPDLRIFDTGIESALSPTFDDSLPLPVAIETPAADSRDKDVLAMSSTELTSMMETAPDDLAQRLNAIEPSAAAAIPEKLDQAAPPPAETTASDTRAEAPAPTIEKAAYSPAPAPAGDYGVTDFLKAQHDTRPLRERIPTDPALPDIIREVEAKAYEGIAEAQHDLAAIYTAGHAGIRVDYARAASWFREAALGGVANARYNLGVLHHQGMGVTQSIHQAVNWYRAAAILGHPEAQYNLGIAHVEGIGTSYDPAQAAYYFRNAAQAGILEAAYNLGLIYENGLAGDIRADEALFWYKQAANMGSPEGKMAFDQLSRSLGLAESDVQDILDRVGEIEKSSLNFKYFDPVSPQADRDMLAQAYGVPVHDDNSTYDETDTLTNGYEKLRIAVIENVVSESHGKDHALVAQIQEQLMRRGLYPGPADGIYNNLTEDAVRAYQTGYELQRDGRISQALLVHMMTSDMEAIDTGVGSR